MSLPFRNMLIGNFTRRTAIILLISLSVNAAFSAARPFTDKGDPFAIYLKRIPKVLQVLSEVNSGTGDSVIITREIVYSSRNDINKVYAVIAYPKNNGCYPALLVLHGGSGNAESVKNVVERFARKGYVAIACDMPGYCNIENTPHSSGPWKLNPAPDERPRFNVQDGAERSSLVDSEVAGIECFNLLASLPNVDTHNIGITGYSWGGYSTTFISGLLGKRVKAAYAYWGCGYFDKGSFWSALIRQMPESDKAVWLKYFDAGRRAGHIKADYFLEAAPNDTFFWPVAVSATLQAIKGEHNHTWNPNVNHSLTPTSGLMQEAFFDFKLKGAGAGFSAVKITRIDQQPDGSKSVIIRLNVPKGVKIDSVAIFFSEKNDSWQKRKWLPVKAMSQGTDKYRAILPADIVNKQIDFYAYVVDSRRISVASYMF